MDAGGNRLECWGWPFEGVDGGGLQPLLCSLSARVQQLSVCCLTAKILFNVITPAPEGSGRVRRKHKELAMKFAVLNLIPKLFQN